MNEYVTRGVKPALILAVVGAVVSTLLTQTIVDFPDWADLLIVVVSVAVGAAGAPVGKVVKR